MAKVTCWGILIADGRRAFDGMAGMLPYAAVCSASFWPSLDYEACGGLKCGHDN